VSLGLVAYRRTDEAINDLEGHGVNHGPSLRTAVVVLAAAIHRRSCVHGNHERPSA
jgi:hypothetical protein